MIVHTIIYENGVVISTSDKGKAIREYSGSLPILHKLLEDYDNRFTVDKGIRAFMPSSVLVKFANFSIDKIVMSNLIPIESLRDFMSHVKKR